MKLRTIQLAKQILTDVPKADVGDLIQLLQYYNKFAESDRVKAMRNGSTVPANESMEGEIKEGLEKTAGSQDVYLMTSQNICRLCGRPV